MHSPGGHQNRLPVVRGKASYSSASRRRLLSTLLSIRSAPQHFITLTYPSHYDTSDHNACFSHLATLIKRLRRRLPGISILWKREYTAAGVLHYHLIFWGASLTGHYEEFSRHWYESCGQIHIDHLASGTKIQPITGAHWHYYLSKYVGKPVDGLSGRFWGFYGRQHLDFYPPLVQQLDYDMYMMLRLCLAGQRMGSRVCELFADTAQIIKELENDFPNEFGN